MGGNSEGSGSHAARKHGATLRDWRRVRRGTATLLLGFFVSSCAVLAAEPVSSLTPGPATREGQQLRLVVHRPTDLAAFFRALDRVRRHEGGGPVRILQLGDSHTAGDVMTSRLRLLFQERFGDAGRGFMPVGLPYYGVRQIEVHVTQAGKWEYHNSLTHPDDGPYGLTGFRATSRSAGASVTVEAVDPAGFDRVEVEAFSYVNGGMLDIEVDGIRQRRMLTSGRPQLLRISIDEIGR